jgi:hypothetical protein
MKWTTLALATTTILAVAADRLHVRPVARESLAGFSWQDAFVGGATVLGAVLVLAGLVLVAHRGRVRAGRGPVAVMSAVLCLGLASLAPVAAGAGPEYKNFTTLPFAETGVSCSGETVEVSGVIRHHVVFVIDGAGGFHGNGLFTAIAKGTSSGGTRYVANFTDHLVQYIAAGEAPVAVTAPFSFRLISNDGTPNLHVRAAFHITIAATGDVTVFVSEFEVECR